ncbi:MAG: Tol-Pal system beta propeller repeat protein TolB [Desulfobacterales bacterium]
MKRYRIAAIGFIILMGSLVGSRSYGAEYDYIDITNPFLRKSPIAIPLFKASVEDPATVSLSRLASDLLSSTLSFTGYFRIVEPDEPLPEKDTGDIVASAIDFGYWTKTGAELLITGGLVVTAGVVEIELRLYDTFKETLVVGKRYKGSVNDYRQIIRRFCSEVTYQMVGSRGFFDSKIAFLSTGSGHKEIYISEFDGFNIVQNTHDQTITLSPSWSSDGKWLAYTSFSKGKADLYIRHLSEKRGAVLNKEGINISPSWVPGRFSLGATLSFSGDQEIYLLTGTGKIIKRLTHSRGIDVSPSFSPDGQKMAFVSRRAGTPQIHIKDLATGQIRRLTFEGRYNTQPSWSPKGDKVAYSSLAGGKSNIYVIGIDGTGMMQLTQDEGDNESPSWSPDGSLLVFSSTRQGPSRIYMMNAFGTDQRRLLALPGEQFEPRWSPNLIHNPESMMRTE